MEFVPGGIVLSHDAMTSEGTILPAGRRIGYQELRDWAAEAERLQAAMWDVAVNRQPRMINDGGATLMQPSVDELLDPKSETE